jgi:hypothetical protein
VGPKVEDHGVRWSDVDQPYRFETAEGWSHVMEANR